MTRFLIFAFLFALFKSSLAADETFSKILTNGILQSPNFPNNYSSNLKYEYEIEALDGWAIALNVEQFSTEFYYDYVIIWQRYLWKGNITHTRHRILSGSGLSETIFFTEISGGFYLRFATDDSVAYPGFRMSFQRFNPAAGQLNHLQPCPNIAIEAKTDDKYLPLIPHQMSVGSSCVFEIHSDAFVYLKAYLQNSGIKLYVYADQKYTLANTTATVLESNDFSFVTSKVNPLLIVISVISQLSNNKPYEISFKDAQNPCSCPQNSFYVGYYYQPVYLSPSYPLNYCNRLRCFTNFFAMRGRQNDTIMLQLEFNDFHVEAIHDLFELHENGKKLKTLTPFDEQNQNMIKTFTFSSSEASINFTTDETITAKGFNLTFKNITIEPHCVCPEQHAKFENQSGNATFEFTCHSMDCFWEIVPPKTTKPATLFLTVEFKLDSSSEFIEVFDDQNTGPDLNTVRLTNSMMPNDGLGKRLIQKDNGQPARIWYHVDKMDIHVKQSVLNFHYKWTTECDCGNLILNASTNWERLFEFDFSTQSCHLLNCTYTINAPQYQSVRLANLTLLDTNLSNENGILRCSGNQLIVHFSGNLSQIGSAFNLVYKSEGQKPVTHHHPVFIVLTSIFLVSTIFVSFLYLLTYRKQQKADALVNGFVNQRFSTLISRSSAETKPM